jgi:hypothetical protein
MDIDSFWGLIGRSATATDDPDERLAWLIDELSKLAPEDIVAFDRHLTEVRRGVDTWAMWGAAYLICDSLCSDDGFWYFQAWLVGLGREAFERVAADPDELAGVPQIQRLAGRPVEDWADAEWPDWESLDYVASEASERVTGEEYAGVDEDEIWDSEGNPRPDPANPDDRRWDVEDPQEAAARLPRISAMFPLSPRQKRDERGRELFDDMLAERGQTEEEFFNEMIRHLG